MSENGFENDADTKIAIQSAIQDALREEGVITTVSVIMEEEGDMIIFTTEFAPYFSLSIDTDEVQETGSCELLNRVWHEVGFTFPYPLELRYQRHGAGKYVIESAVLIIDHGDIEELKNRAAQKKEPKILARIKRLINRL